MVVVFAGYYVSHAPPLKARNEELLYFLLWSVETLTRPTFRNVTESFEGWAYRSGLSRELARLEKRKLIEKRGATDRVYRLTAEGRLHALGGRDPQLQWSRFWDGRWRLVCFDVPIFENKQRARLRRYLRNHGFGYLQNSIWITPDPLREEAALLASTRANVESLILWEAITCGGESTAEIVTGAWDFTKINDCYRKHLNILENKPKPNRAGKIDAEKLRLWARAERQSWQITMAIDPLLPKVLLPRGYLGQKVWKRRAKTFKSARHDLERAT